MSACTHSRAGHTQLIHIDQKAGARSQLKDTHRRAVLLRCCASDGRTHRAAASASGLHLHGVCMSFPCTHGSPSPPLYKLPPKLSLHPHHNSRLLFLPLAILACYSFFFLGEVDPILSIYPVQARLFNPKQKKDPGGKADRDIKEAVLLVRPVVHRHVLPLLSSCPSAPPVPSTEKLREQASKGEEEALDPRTQNQPILFLGGGENAADLVDAAGPGPFHVSGKGEEGGGGGARDGAAVVGDAVGRGLRDLRRRVLPPRREGHQPGHLHRLGGIRVPGRHHLLRRLRRARAVGPLRRQGRPGVAAAVAPVPLAGGRGADVAHRRREEAQRLPVRPLEAVLPGRRRRRGRGAPPKPAPRRRQQRLHGSVHRQAGRADGDRERRRLACRPCDHVRRRRRHRRPAHRRLQARLAPGEGAHHAVQGPRALPRRRARRAPGVAAGQGGAGAGHVACVRRLLRQGLRRHLGAGGDAEEGHRPGPVRHPGHRRGLGRALQRGGGADRGRDAGQGEGGETPRRVRRPRVEAQAAGHRRRRLLGGLPLLPLAGVLSKLPPGLRLRCRHGGKGKSKPIHLLVRSRSISARRRRPRLVSDWKVQFAS